MAKSIREMFPNWSGEQGTSPSFPRGFEAPVDETGRVIKQRKELTQKIEIKPEEREYWARVSNVVLPRFPELQRGECIGVREIKRRLGEIRKTGYEIESYSAMTKDEAWKYLMKVRTDVASNAKYYCPDVLQEIRFRDARQKLDARGDLR